jgi:hypothetical protein
VTVALKVTDWFVPAGLRDDEREVVDVAEVTTWLTGADVLPLKVADPWYAPVIECVPALSEEKEIAAVPLASVALPIGIEPS